MVLECDIQYSRGVSGFKLTKVGVTGVRRPVLIRREGLTSPLNSVVNCSMDIFVDLPAVQKGSHLSRNVEVIREVAEGSVASPVTGLENMAVDIVKRLLVKHEYAEHAEVCVRAEYFRPSRTPSGRGTLESYSIVAGARAERGGRVSKIIGVEATGMSACPCAQETVSELIGVRDPGFPLMTHNQRNVCTITLTVDEDAEIEADDLIDLAERSYSSPTFELLKREDEGRVVINAHSNTCFVEDVVRNGLTNVVGRYTDLPDDTVVHVASDSQESIHKHNANAERTATLGELRRERALNIKHRVRERIRYGSGTSSSAPPLADLLVEDSDVFEIDSGRAFEPVDVPGPVYDDAGAEELRVWNQLVPAVAAELDRVAERGFALDPVDLLPLVVHGGVEQAVRRLLAGVLLLHTLVRFGHVLHALSIEPFPE